MTAALAPATAVLVLAPLILCAVLWPAAGRPPVSGGDPARSRTGTRGGSRRGSRWTRHGARRAGPRARGRRSAAAEEGLAELVGVLASPLRSGVPPSVAVDAAAAVLTDGSPLGSLVSDLSSAAGHGASLADVWHSHAVSRDSADLLFVARAWALSEQSGAPLAEALSCAEQVLLARVRARERLASAAAGPRASMAVLCLLPASGPAVGLVMGVDPVALYFSSPVGAGSLALGVILGLGAWAWSRRILRGIV